MNKRKKDGVYREFKIPNRFKNLCTREWCKIFKQELDKIFKLDKKRICDLTYMDLEGTGGWFDAFKYACENHPHKHMGVGLLRYYNSLEWYDSDLFDDNVCNIMIDNLSITKKSYDDYYGKCEENMNWVEGEDYGWVFDKQLKDVKIYTQKILF